MFQDSAPIITWEWNSLYQTDSTANNSRLYTNLLSLLIKSQDNCVLHPLPLIWKIPHQMSFLIKIRRGYVDEIMRNQQQAAA